MDLNLNLIAMKEDISTRLSVMPVSCSRDGKKRTREEIEIVEESLTSEPSGNNRVVAGRMAPLALVETDLILLEV